VRNTTVKQPELGLGQWNLGLFIVKHHGETTWTGLADPAGLFREKHHGETTRRRSLELFIVKHHGETAVAGEQRGKGC
jgi:hypothetical protein